MNNRPRTIQIYLPKGEPRGLRLAELTTSIVRVAVWKAVTQESVSYQGQRDASFLAKLFARFLD